MRTLTRLPLLVVLAAFLVIAPGCTETPEKTAESKESLEAPAKPWTRAEAAAVAERLIREQGDPAYQEGIRLYGDAGIAGFRFTSTGRVWKATIREQQAAAYNAALAAFDPLARQGNSMALFYSARARQILQGLEGFEGSFEEMRELFLRACRMGNPYAMLYAGSRKPHAGSLGMDAWWDHALAYWEIRAAENDAEALFALGMNREENGLYRDVEAALLGCEVALLEMSFPYDDGPKFRDPDLDHSRYLGFEKRFLEKLLVLAENGNAVAQYNYGVAQNEPVWLEKSAESGYSKALRRLSTTDVVGRELEMRRVKYAAIVCLLYNAPPLVKSISLSKEDLEAAIDAGFKWLSKNRFYSFVHPLMVYN